MTGDDPRPIREAYADVIAELVAAAPPLSTAQLERIRALLRPAPQTPASSPPPVASARSASHGLSAGATLDPHRDHTAPATPDRPPRGLRRPAFRAIPRRTT